MKIFLDIDGVMVHANPSRKLEFDNDGFYKFNKSAIVALQEIYNNSSNSGNEVILSTSHRFRFSIVEWKRIFSSRGLKIKKISRIETCIDYKISRKVEILNWISERNLDINDIIIIDDDKSLNGLSKKLKKRLVLTNPYTGLDSSIVECCNKKFLSQRVEFYTTIK